MNESPDPAMISVTDKLPPSGERVMVVCKGFRCLGLLDQDSIWRDIIRGTELPQVIGWFPLGPPD